MIKPPHSFDSFVARLEKGLKDGTILVDPHESNSRESIDGLAQASANPRRAFLKWVTLSGGVALLATCTSFVASRRSRPVEGRIEGLLPADWKMDAIFAYPAGSDIPHYSPIGPNGAFRFEGIRTGQYRILIASQIRNGGKVRLAEGSNAYDSDTGRWLLSFPTLRMSEYVSTIIATFYFEVNSSYLDERAHRSLGKFRPEGVFPNTRFIVYGYTDSSGTIAHNQNLSEQRARAVFAGLKYKIGRFRTDIAGLGQLPPRDREVFRQEDRRVDVWALVPQKG